MKDQKRQHRRHQAEVLLERRARKNHYWTSNKKEQTWAGFWKKVKSGKTCTWMRSMSTPCSCYICSGYHKYKRPDSGTVKKEIHNLLSEYYHGI